MRSELRLLGGGALLDTYREVLPTSVASVGPLRSRLLSIVDRSEVKLSRQSVHTPPRRLRLAQVRELASHCSNSNLVYVNTVQAGPVLWALPAQRPPIILHLHEMTYGLRHLAHQSPARQGMAEDEYLDRTFHLADTVLVPSEANRRQVLAISPSIEDRCHVIPEMIDVNSLRAQKVAADELLMRLGIPTGSLVVVGGGSFDWRKGIDLFVQVASRVVPAFGSQAVFFLWIGAPSNSAAYTIAWTNRRQFDFDVRSVGLADRLILVPPTSNVGAYLAIADVFLLPSREDPFPLIAVEATALGRPVVCFDSSGTAEMIGHDAGAVVPHLDVVAMSAAVERLLKDQPARLAAGAIAAGRAGGYDVSEIAPRVLAAIDRLIRLPSRNLAPH